VFFQEYDHTDTKILLFKCRYRFPKYHHYDLGNHNMGESAFYAKVPINKMTKLKYLETVDYGDENITEKCVKNLLLICYSKGESC
jgi:hypothetical protein